MNTLNNNKHPNNSTQNLNIPALQAYITQLSSYINQNNQTYTRNLSTLKNFYEQQIDEKDDLINSKEQDILRQKNEINILKDLLQQRNTELKEVKGKNDELRDNIREMQDFLNNQREKNKKTYQHIDQLREKMQANVDKEVQRCRAAEEQCSNSKMTVKEKQNEIKMLKNQIIELQDKIALRHSLPERMKDLEIEKAKDRTKIENLEKSLKEITQNRDYISTMLEKTKKQLQKATIQANKSKGDLSYEIQIAVKKEKNKLTEQIDTLKIDNERKIYEIKDLQLKLKQKVKLCNQLQTKLKQLSNKMEDEKKQLRDLKEDKQLYLSQFRNLKIQYELVIRNLENSIPEYQKKNWNLQQQNQQLQTQLNTLSDLLRELKAMNDMEPIRGQYRKWAELSLAAEKKLPQQEPQPSNIYTIRQNQSQLNPDWSKLMADIEKIQI